VSADLPEAARAFVEGDVALLPSALADPEIEQLVTHLIARGDVERLQRLADASDKRLAKPARRGLHLLKTRGQAIPEAKKREFRLTGPYASSNEPDGLVSLVDGNGERVVWLVRPGQDGFDVFQVELSEINGIIGFQPGHAPKKEWRQHVESVTRDVNAESGRVVARSPYAHVRWLVEKGYQRTIAAGRTPPEDFARARLELGPLVPPPEGEAHAAQALAPPLPLDEARPRLAALHELPEISLWVPPRESLDALDLELGQIATSKLVVASGDRQEQIARVIDKLAGEVAPELRLRLAERLEESALILVARGRSDEARLCTTCAGMLRDEAAPGASNPFLRQMFEKLIKPEVKETP
jgi:hypothetical protein